MGAPSSFVFSFYSDKYPEVELLDHVLVLFLQHSLFTHFHISGHLGLLSPFWIFFVFVFCEFFLGGWAVRWVVSLFCLHLYSAASEIVHGLE